MTERRSARANKGARYKEYVSNGQLNFVWEKEEPPVCRPEPTHRLKNRTLKYILEQTAVLPEIGEPDTDVDCRLYTTDEIDAALGLVDLSRQFEEKRIPDQGEIEAALAIMELSRKCEERRAADQEEKAKKTSKRKASKTSKRPAKKRAKK